MSRIVEIPAQVLIVRLECGCGGVMSYTGEMKPSNPPVYKNRCERCGQEEVHQQAYPTTRVVPLQ